MRTARRPVSWLSSTPSRMPSTADRDPALERIRYRFRGVIQGVGFRPTVYRVAVALGLTGFVRNERSIVVAEIQGAGAAHFEEVAIAIGPGSAC